MNEILRFQPLPSLIQWLEGMKQHYRNITKKCDRLRTKLLTLCETQGVSLDDQSHQDFQQVLACTYIVKIIHECHCVEQIMVSETPTVLQDLPENSFHRLFWEQQFEAAKQKDTHTMHWHPLMIRWCLYLRHK